MNVRWTSRKGNHRHKNSDAMACCQTSNWMVTIVVDASERGPVGDLFANLWAKNIIQACQQALLKNDDELLSQSVIELMESEHAHLRQQFSTVVASYTLVCIHKASRKLFSLHCGDCLVAFESDTGQRHWLISPHICAIESERHLLTRSFNAKRFIEPELTESTFDITQTIAIYTDGYWSEHVNGQIAWDELADDASELLLQVGEEAYLFHSDSDNAYICGL